MTTCYVDIVFLYMWSLITVHSSYRMNFKSTVGNTTSRIAKWPPGTGEWRCRASERVTPQADPDRAGEIARLEEIGIEVFDFPQDHRTSHNREEPGGVADRPQVERQLPNMTMNHIPDVPVHDRDAEQQGTAEMYTDVKHAALYSNVNVWCHSEHHSVHCFPQDGQQSSCRIARRVQYSRNITHVRQYLIDVDAAPRGESDSRNITEITRELHLIFYLQQCSLWDYICFASLIYMQLHQYGPKYRVCHTIIMTIKSRARSFRYSAFVIT